MKKPYWIVLLAFAAGAATADDAAIAASAVVQRMDSNVEAYVAEGIINSWAMMKTNQEIRLAAGDAMYKVHKKNQKAMRAMFKTGW